MGVVKGIISNGLANIVQKLVRIADQLLLVPFFLTHWGGETYGEWLTLTIIPSVLAFSDLGIGSSVSNSFVLAYASGDKQKSANINKSGFLITSISVFLGVLLTAFVITICVKFDLFDKSHIQASDAMFAVIFMMAAKLLTFFNQIVEGYFRAVRKAAMGSLMASGANILNVIVGLIVLQLGCNVASFAFSQLVVSLCFTIFYTIIGRRLVCFDNCRGVIIKSDVKDLVKKGVGYMTTPIWQCVYFQGSTFVVRLVLGAEAVAAFNTIRTVCRSVNQIFSVLNASIFPDLQYEYGRGNLPLVQKLFRIAVISSFIVGFCGFIVLSLWGLELYGWWTQSVLSVSQDVWFVFLVGVLLNAVWWTSTVTYRMTNKPYHFAIASTITAFCSVALSYFLAKFFGLLGAAIGCTIFEFVMALFVLPDSCKLLKMRTFDLVKHVKSDASAVTQKILRSI